MVKWKKFTLKKATVIKILAFALLILSPLSFYIIYGPGFERSITQSWGRITHDTTEIRTIVAVNNPTPLSRWLKKIEFDLYINDFKIASETSEKTVEIKPFEKTEISLTSFLNNSKIPSLWAAYVSKGSFFNVTLNGNATFRTAVREIIFPIGYITRAHTNLLELLKIGPPKDLRVGTATITLESLNLTWGEVTLDQTEINSKAEIYNPNIYPITIRRINYTIEMNRVRMGEGTIYSPTVIEAKTDNTISFTATLNNNMLDQWWATHLRNDQITGIALRLQGIAEVLGTEYSFPIAEVEGTASIQILGGTITYGYFHPIL